MKSLYGAANSAIDADNADELAMRNLAKSDKYGIQRPLSAGERTRYIQNILASAKSDAIDEVPLFHRRVYWHAVAAVAAAVILMALFWGLKQPSTNQGMEASSALRATAPALGRFLLIEGDVFLDGSPVTHETHLREERELAVSNGNVVVTVADGIRVSLSDDTSAVFRRPDRTYLEAYLKRGTLWASVDPAVARRRLRITTEHGQVFVKGTVFSVSINAGHAEVAVLRGAVDLVDTRGRSRALTAGREGTIGSAESVPLEETRMRDAWQRLEILAMAKRLSPSTSVSVEPPKSLLVEEMSTPETTPDTGRNAASTPVRRALLKRSQLPKPESASTVVLISEVRQARRNKDWQRAARGYEALIAHYPNTASAKAALVALGELRLEKLHNPRGALSMFNRYLDTQGIELQSEALFGKARALQMLGYRMEEEAALKSFIDRFPNAVQSPAARRRLGELLAGNRF